MKPIKEFTINGFNSLLDFIQSIRGIYGNGRYLEIKVYEATRSTQQNRALHKWFSMIATELNEKGIDKREFFKEPFFMRWSKDNVKEDIWRPVQRAMKLGTSTTELGRSELDQVLDPIIIKLAEHGISVPFPNKDLE